MEQLYIINRYCEDDQDFSGTPRNHDTSERLQEILKKAKERREAAKTRDSLVVSKHKKKEKFLSDETHNTALTPSSAGEAVHHKKKKKKLGQDLSQTFSEEQESDNYLQKEHLADDTQTRKKTARKRKCSSDYGDLCEDIGEDGLVSREEPKESQNIATSKSKRKKKIEAITEVSNRCEIDRSKNEGADDSNYPSEKLTSFHGVDDPESPSITKKQKKKKVKISSNLLSNVSRDENEDESFEDDHISKELDNTEESEQFPVLGEVVASSLEKVQRVLPDWLSNPEVVTSDLHNSTLNIRDLPGLDGHLQKQLLKNNIRYFFPVQEKVIPWLLSSAQRKSFFPPQDVCVSAPTGSGKTLAYVLPIVQCLKDRVVTAVRAIVLVPVRELASQVYDVFMSYCQGTSLKVEVLVGARSFAEEQSFLVKNSIRGPINLVDVIVATPGRLLDHLRKTSGFSIRQLKFLVLDEADRLIEEVQTGLIQEIERAVYDAHVDNCSCILNVSSRLSSQPLTVCSFQNCREPVQKLLYSATLSQDPEKLQSLGLFCPKLFTSVVKTDRATKRDTSTFVGKYTTPSELKEMYSVCKNKSFKPLIVWHLVKILQFKGMLCFTDSKENAHRLCFLLKYMGGVAVQEFSSDLKPAERNKIINKFVSGGIDILVCSNVLARGLDVSGVKFVINYDPPKYLKTYIHRVGRTARAGTSGTAVTLLLSEQIKEFTDMLDVAQKTNICEYNISEEELKPHYEEYKTALKNVQGVINCEKNERTLRKKIKPVRKYKNNRNYQGFRNKR